MSDCSGWDACGVWLVDGTSSPSLTSTLSSYGWFCISCTSIQKTMRVCVCVCVCVCVQFLPYLR